MLTRFCPDITHRKRCYRHPSNQTLLNVFTVLKKVCCLFLICLASFTNTGINPENTVNSVKERPTLKHWKLCSILYSFFKVYTKPSAGNVVLEEDKWTAIESWRVGQLPTNMVNLEFFGNALLYFSSPKQSWERNAGTVPQQVVHMGGREGRGEHHDNSWQQHDTMLSVIINKTSSLNQHKKIVISCILSPRWTKTQRLIYQGYFTLYDKQPYV